MIKHSKIILVMALTLSFLFNNLSYAIAETSNDNEIISTYLENLGKVTLTNNVTTTIAKENDPQSMTMIYDAYYDISKDILKIVQDKQYKKILLLEDSSTSRQNLYDYYCFIFKTQNIDKYTESINQYIATLKPSNSNIGSNNTKSLAALAAAPAILAGTLNFTGNLLSYLKPSVTQNVGNVKVEPLFIKAQILNTLQTQANIIIIDPFQESLKMNAYNNSSGDNPALNLIMDKIQKLYENFASLDAASKRDIPKEKLDEINAYKKQIENLLSQIQTTSFLNSLVNGSIMYHTLTNNNKTCIMYYQIPENSIIEKRIIGKKLSLADKINRSVFVSLVLTIIEPNGTQINKLFRRTISIKSIPVDKDFVKSTVNDNNSFNRVLNY